MSDTYQAVYDAVRSRISNGNVGHAVEEVARQALDTGMLIPRALELIGIAESVLRAPHVTMRPRVYPDGDRWCALYGEDLQSGVAGFGLTPELACADFDKNWTWQRVGIQNADGAQK